MKESLWPHGGFPYRLDYIDSDRVKRTCWFECEDHLVKQVTKCRLERKKHQAKIQVEPPYTLENDPLATKPPRKRKTTPKRASGTKGSQESKTEKPITKGKQVGKPTPARQKAKKSVFSNVEDFFTK